jgi:hypothetical protein
VDGVTCLALAIGLLSLAQWRINCLFGDWIRDLTDKVQHAELNDE